MAVQGKSNMAVGSEFGKQEILDVAAGTVGPCDQVVGRRERADPVIDAGPDLWLVMQHLMQNRVNGRRFVLQPVLKLVDDDFAIFFLRNQALRYLALLRDDRPIMFDAQDRQPADGQIDEEQRQPGKIGLRVAEIRGYAEGPPGQRGYHAGPETAERGDKRDGRNIRGEEHVRPDLREPPPR